MSSAEEEKKRMSRREFVKGAAVGAAVAGAGVLTSCQGTTAEPTSAPAIVPEATAAPDPASAKTWDYEVDVLVAGAGNAGMCAGIRAAENGANTMIVEISAKTGGGTAWSGGYLHTEQVENWEDYNKHTEGLHDQVLGKVYVETFHNEYIPWLLEKGAQIEDRQTDPSQPKDWRLGQGETGQLAHRVYFDSLEEAFTSAGGTIVLKSRVQKLITDDDGNLMGVEASTWKNSPVEKNQETFTIKTKAVILCTGSFFANPEMRQKYISPWADLAVTYGTPYARGEGIKMAEKLGAAMSRSMNTWSGVICAKVDTEPAYADPETFEQLLADTDPQVLRATVFAGYSYPPGWLCLADITPGGTRGILVNLDGKRFIDEASPIASKYPRQPNAVVRQRQAMAFLIGDKVIYDEVTSSEAVINNIIDLGGKVVIADTIEECAEKLEEQGVYKGNFLRTIAEYNQAIDDSKADELDPPRYDGFYKISAPPFYAIPVTGSIYYNFGGLAIDKNAQVLDMQRIPIPGLFASSPPGGGIQNTIYTGGIGTAGVFGYIAGKSAAEYVKA